MSEKKIGAKIVIDGEQEFRSALNSSKTALKEFDSELKLVTTQFKNNEKSMEALKSKQAVYQKQQQELTKQSKILVEQIQKANEAYKKAEDAQQKQIDKIKKLESALEKAKKEYGDSSDEVKQLEQELSEANQEYEKQERSITQLSNKISKWNTDLNKTETELVECDRALEETNDAIDNYGKEVDDAQQETKKFGIVMNEAGEGTEKLRVSLGSLVSAQVVVDVLRQCAHAIKEVATAAVEVGMKFEASMSKVEALSGASGDSLERLTAKAKEMGASTVFSASEAADAFSYMALAGWDAEQMLEGIEPVLNLAAAANMDLAEASDIVTDYLTAFGLKAEDAAHFSDAMAKAMSSSNTNVEQLGEAYKNCAATCATLGIEMEDATAVLATMANAGVKGSEAGTALNSILTRLATNTKGAADKLEEYGVKVYDAQGNMNSLSSILNGLGNVWGTLSDKEQAALAKSIAGVSHYSKFQTIMLGVSEAAKEGGMSFNDYAESLRNCEGAAEEMARVMQDNLQGDITILKSALEGLGIATEGVFDESFREAVQGATDAVSQLEKAVTSGDLGVSLSELGDAVAEMTANLVDAATDALPGFIDKLTWIVNNVDIIGAGITTLVGALASYKIATVAATVATEGFTVVLNTNPYVLAATAIATLTIGLIELDKASTKALETENEATRATNHEIAALQQTIDTLDESAKKRQEDTTAMDNQLAASKKLSAELFDENTTNERRKQIISELKEMYPQLNIAMSEQGEIIGATKEQVDQYIESSMKMAKVEAAREHLTQIAKDQFEAEMALAEAKEKVADKQKELTDAQKDADAEAKTHTDAFGNVVDVYNEYDIAVEQAKEGVEGLKTKQEECEERVKTLGDEYNRTLEYIDNNAPIDEATESFNGMADAESNVNGITEEMQKEFEELQKSIESSISSSLDLTQKWSQEWSTKTDTMTQNIQSQIDGIENWEKNFEALATTSKVSISDNVMKYLAEMGTEGAGLVQQLVNELETAPESVQGFSDSLAEYLKLEDSVAQEITDSYVTCVTDGIDGAVDAITDSSGALGEATGAMSEALEKGMEDAAQKGSEAMKTALEESATTNVKPAAEKVGDEVIKGIQDKTGANGEKVKEIGTKSDKALGDGLKAGKAKEAAQTVSEEVYGAFEENLSADAGNEIGTNFMNALADAIESLGNEILENARSIAEEAKSILESASESSSSSSGEGGGDVEGYAEGLAYVPYDNFYARLHEGERVLTKEENKQYSALLGNVSSPSFDVVESQLGDLAAGRAVVINNDIKVDGAQDPEAWTQTFIRTLKREARMA